jgi:hypothetical protein
VSEGRPTVWVGEVVLQHFDEALVGDSALWTADPRYV